LHNVDAGCRAQQQKVIAGNDTYVVQNTGDKAIESANQGTDRVNASATFALGANIEFLTLTGSGNINGTGNAGNNIIRGNAGDNTLRGLGGNDTYVVQDTGDTVIEAANQGTDRVNSSVSFTLGNNVEDLILTGNGAIDGTGNALDNRITGNGASNTLTGGDGDDIFIFNAALNAATNVDDVTDFSVVDDAIRLDNAVFTGLAGGLLDAGAFTVGAQALQADDRIIYDPFTGALIFDLNGNAAGGATKFAQLDAGLGMIHTVFFVA
jgi:serralysin